MAHSDERSPIDIETEDSKKAFPRDRDQSLYGPGRAHDVADRAEYPAADVADNLAADGALLSRDNMQDPKESFGSGASPVMGHPSRHEPESLAERRRRIAEAAYYRAQGRAFSPGNEEADWFAAEQEFDGKR